MNIKQKSVDLKNIEKQPKVAWKRLPSQAHLLHTMWLNRRFRSQTGTRGALQLHQEHLNLGNDRLASEVNAVRGEKTPGWHPRPDTISNHWTAIMEQQDIISPAKSTFSSQIQLQAVTEGNNIRSSGLRGVSQSDCYLAKKVNYKGRNIR